MTPLEIPFGKIDVQETARKLKERCAYKLKNEANWCMANNGLICCFVDKCLYLADDRLNPLLMAESESFLSACGISRSGNYIVCQTAYNREHKDDGIAVLFDVKKREILAQTELEIDANATRLIFVNDEKRIICFYVADRILGDGNNIVVKYDFDFRADESTLKEYYKKPDLSPYTVNGRIRRLVSEIDENFIQEKISEIEELFEIVRRNDKMSSYQLSETCKVLGEMYAKYGMKENAIQKYKVGLELNPRLAVKKALKILETQ